MADAPKSFFLTPEIHQYLVAHAAPVDDVQRWLIDETNSKFADRSMMQISPEQGAVMTLLTRLTGARHAVEVGTFTGYSSLCIAYGLPADGHLLCCDVSEEWTDIAQEGWKRAGVDDRIELRIAPAIDTLRALPTDAVIDLAFIDADKTGYLGYYEELLPRLRTNGVILVDNTLWSGRITDSALTDDDTLAIRAFNDHVAADDRVDSAILTLGDGVTIARKR
jgi:caffeoyl-CoA O-methyltransferase